MKNERLTRLVKIIKSIPIDDKDLSKGYNVETEPVFQENAILLQGHTLMKFMFFAEDNALIPIYRGDRYIDLNEEILLIL